MATTTPTPHSQILTPPALHLELNTTYVKAVYANIDNDTTETRQAVVDAFAAMYNSSMDAHTAAKKTQSN